MKLSPSVHNIPIFPSWYYVSSPLSKQLGAIHFLPFRHSYKTTRSYDEKIKNCQLQTQITQLVSVF